MELSSEFELVEPGLDVPELCCTIFLIKQTISSYPSTVIAVNDCSQFFHSRLRKLFSSEFNVEMLTATALEDVFSLQSAALII